ncbi:hypothetical protein [Clavibacter tessellarius]|uniref:hypothetical protein n=1 Tax=Clavibacter tessellarius TaxID=31965 RepID=UPI003253B227
MRRFLGIDLAWAEGTAARPARETGLACIDGSGRVLDLATARGVDEVVAWIARWDGPGAVAAVDGPLVVANATGSRLAEKEVASRYGRLGISAYPSNRACPPRGGRAPAAARGRGLGVRRRLPRRPRPRRAHDARVLPVHDARRRPRASASTG